MISFAYRTSRELDVLDPAFMANDHARHLVYDTRGVPYQVPTLGSESGRKPGNVDVAAVYVPAVGFREVHRSLACPVARGAYTRVGDEVWRRVVNGVPTGLYVLARCRCGELRYLPRAGWITGYRASVSCSTCSRRDHRSRRSLTFHG